MPQFSEYRCEACNLYFQIDLDPDEVAACPLCAHPRPKLVEIVPERLCSRCAGRKPAAMTDEQLVTAIDQALDEADL
jgi:hypothetical protein